MHIVKQLNWRISLVGTDTLFYEILQNGHPAPLYGYRSTNGVEGEQNGLLVNEIRMILPYMAAIAASAKGRTMTNTPDLILIDAAHWFTTAQATGLEDPSLSNRWVVDSGATDHFKASSEGISFTSEKKIKIGMANANVSKISGSGTYELNEFTTLSNVIVLPLPDLRFNLLSVAKCTEAGVDVHFSKQKCRFEKDGRILVSATKKHGLFIH